MNKKVIYFILISLVITDSFRIINNQGFIRIESATYIAAFLKYISLFIIIRYAYKSKWHNDIPNDIKNIYKVWLWWLVFELFRGAILAQDYWDWKFLMLSSVPFSLVPLIFYFGKSLKIVKYNFNFVLKFLFPFGFLLIPLSLIASLELYARIMISVNLFILFIPYVKFRWKILIIGVAVISVLFHLGFRTNIIKVAFSFVLLSSYYYRKLISQRILRLAHFTLFIVPVILLFLGINNKFNVFKYLSEQKPYYTQSRTGGVESLTADTRSFIYYEVLSSIAKTGNWIIGEGASGGYYSIWREAINNKRYGSEVGILNILLYDGLIGVIIYFSLLYFVSLTAIKKSNNYLSKMLGLFIAFRWTTSFIEEFTQYDLNFYFFWLAVGLVSSTAFRMRSDEELKSFFKLV
jgi:hypothetical protein